MVINSKLNIGSNGCNSTNQKKDSDLESITSVNSSMIDAPLFKSQFETEKIRNKCSVAQPHPFHDKLWNLFENE